MVPDDANPVTSLAALWTSQAHERETVLWEDALVARLYEVVLTICQVQHMQS